VAVLLGAGGSAQEFSAMLDLARLDWRDLLENGDYAKVMRRRLGR
jgi:hypothetical protein